MSKKNDFIQRLKKVGNYHPDLYDYSKAEYVNKNKPVLIIHKKYGTEHFIKAELMYAKMTNPGVRNAVDKTKFQIEKFKEKYGELYDYSQYKFNGAHSECTIICKIHGVFKTIDNVHTNGVGRCPKCIGRGNVYDRTFEETANFVKKLKLNSYTEYAEFCANSKKDFPWLPPNPHYTYKGEWTSWADFLGYAGNGQTAWTKNAISAFLESCQHALESLDNIELISLLESNKLYRKLNQYGLLQRLLTSASHSESRITTLREFANLVDGTEDCDTSVENEGSTLSDFVDVQEIITKTNAIHGREKTQDLEESLTFSQNSLEELQEFDNELLMSSFGEEQIDFLKQYRLDKLWFDILNQKEKIETLQEFKGGNFSQWVVDHLLQENAQLSKIDGTEEYSFAKPNLMQRLFAHRVANNRIYGNWSGTGAGKTLAAILATRNTTLELNNVIIITNNSTIGGWIKSIKTYYPNSNVFTKQTISDCTDTNLYQVVNLNEFVFPTLTGAFNYLVVNYETFNSERAVDVVENLLKNKIDCLIFDEVQNIKNNQSNTNENLNHLRTQVETNNPTVHLIAMSATPLVNNLVEAKTILQVMYPEKYSNVATTETLANAINVYKLLKINGIRYIPVNINDKNELVAIAENKKEINIDFFNPLINNILNSRKGDLLQLESLLIDLKLEAIKEWLTNRKANGKKTMIYTNYVDAKNCNAIISKIQNFLGNLGISYGVCIGEDKTGLEEFRQGKIDVLIGSTPVTTGVDGIQKVCDGLAILIAPWTSAEYDQLKGRIVRQGTLFNNVDIVIPQVVVSHEGIEWSWDKQRWLIVERKKTLVDCALDGKIPDSHRIDRKSVLEAAKKELEELSTQLKK